MIKYGAYASSFQCHIEANQRQGHTKMRPRSDPHQKPIIAVALPIKTKERESSKETRRQCHRDIDVSKDMMGGIIYLRNTNVYDLRSSPITNRLKI